jgi:hypothetical protein
MGTIADLLQTTLAYLLGALDIIVSFFIQMLELIVSFAHALAHIIS